MAFFTYSEESNVACDVIRSIHTNTNANEIKDDLVRIGLKVVDVAPMSTSRGPIKPLPLYRVKVEKASKTKEELKKRRHIHLCNGQHTANYKGCKETPHPNKSPKPKAALQANKTMAKPPAKKVNAAVSFANTCKPRQFPRETTPAESGSTEISSFVHILQVFLE